MTNLGVMKSLHGLLIISLMHWGLAVKAQDHATVIDVPIFRFVSSDFGDSALKNAKSKKRVFGCKQVTYAINAPQAGMYGLYLAAANWETRISINDEQIAFTKIIDVGMDRLQEGSHVLHQIATVQLKRGHNTLRFDRKVFPGIGYIASIRLVRNQQPQTRVDAKLVDYRGYYRRGDLLHIDVAAEALSKRAFQIIAQLDVAGKTVRELASMYVHEGRDVQHKTFEIPIDFDGAAKLRLLVDGKDVMRPASVVAFDMQAKPRVAQHQKEDQLVLEIDCTKTNPQYHGNGPTRIESHAGLTYRESALQGVYDQGHNQGSWFAYTLDNMQVGQNYRVEVDYPDDKVRTFTVSLIDQPQYGQSKGLIPYALDSGVASGAEFPNSNTIQKLSIDFRARRNDARLLFLNWHGSLRAAVSVIRLYRVDDVMPSLDLKHPAVRHQAMFNEEPDRWYGFYAGLDVSQEQMLVAADRYARWCRGAGFDTIWDTVAIYGQACWPSEIFRGSVYPGFMRETNYPTGIVLPMLLTAERYGLKYIGEIHPPEFMVTLPSIKESPEIYTSDRRGKKLLNPLHPTVQQWGISLVREFANHASLSPAFAGVSIRWMSWVNSGWASFNAIDAGMDDWTIKAFCEDSQIDISILWKENAARRWRWIKQNKLDDFKAWKNHQMVAYYRKLLAAIRSARPDLKLYVHRFGSSEAFGFSDISQLSAVEGIEVTRSSAGYPTVRRVKDPTLLAVCTTNKTQQGIEPVGKNSFFSNVYMECDFALAELGLGSKPGQKMRICGAINPPGRMRYKRYVQLLQNEPLPELFADGGLGYVQGDMILRQEFAKAYLSLPLIKYEKLNNDDPVALWQGQQDGKWYMYMLNVSHATVKVSLQSPASQINQLADDVSVSLDGSIELKPFAMRSFIMDDAIVSMQVHIPSSVTQAMVKQLAFARKIYDLPQIDEPRILDISPEDYEQAGQQLEVAKVAIKQGKLLDFEKTIRMGMDRGKNGKAKNLTGLARLYAARKQYPLGVYTVDAQALINVTENSSFNADKMVQLSRKMGDIRQVFLHTLDKVVDDRGFVYLLQKDGRIVVQDQQARYIQTLYTDKPADECQSLRIVKGWVMLSSQVGKSVSLKPSDVMQPYAQSVMHTLPDGSVGFLSKIDRARSNMMALYQITPQLSKPQLLLRLQGEMNKKTKDFCSMGSEVLFSGGFNRQGCQLGIWSLSTEQKQAGLRFIEGQLGSVCSVNLFGMAPTSNANRIIIRKVDNWTRLKLVTFDFKKNIAIPFFDIQAHFKMHGHQNIYSVVKHFAPWELAYRIERYPDGSGYALLVSPLCTVYRLDENGKVLWASGVKAEGSGDQRNWSWPADISVDDKGQLWIVDRDTSTVDVLDKAGKRLSSFGQAGRLDATEDDAFWKPQGIATTTDKHGQSYLYIGDTGNRRIVEFKIK